MTSIFNASLIALILGTLTAQSNHRGFYYFPQNYITYDMTSLCNTKRNEFQAKVTEDTTVIQGTLFVNVCEELVVPEKCGDQSQLSHAYFVFDDKTGCLNLISSSVLQNSYQFLKNDSINSQTMGFSISKLTNNFNLIFKCNPDNLEPNFILDIDTLTIESADACGYVNESARVFKKTKIFWSVLMIIFGIMLTFFGGYKWNYLTGLFGFVFGFALVFLTLWLSVSSTINASTYALVSLLAIAIGVVSSYIFRTFSEFAYPVFGFTSGFFLTKNIFYLLQYSGRTVRL
jgi:hypothetical protein